MQQVLFLDSANATMKDLSTGRASWITTQPIGNYDKPQVALFQFSFTNFFVNVNAGMQNNKFYYSDDPSNPTKYNVTIPDGAYSAGDFNELIKGRIRSDQGKEILSLQCSLSTNRMYITFADVTGWYVHFGADSPFELLGFTSGQNVPASKANTANYLEFAGATAAFNQIQTIKITSNLTNYSINNTNQSAVLYTCQPNVIVGNVQVTEPNNLMWIPSEALKGKVNEISVRLFDQDDNPIYMAEDFSLVIGIA